MINMNEYAEGLVKRFYTTEDTPSTSFARQTKEERRQTLLEFGFANFKAANIGLSFLQKRVSESINSPHFQEQRNGKMYRTIAASNGDITKLKETKTVMNLLQYVIDTNNSLDGAKRSEGTMAAIRIAQSLLDTISIRARNKNIIKQSIERERKSLTKKDVGLYEAYYNLTTLYIFVIVDAFYGRAIQANIDYSVKPPVVGSFSFSIDANEFDAERTLAAMIANEHKFYTTKTPITEAYAEAEKAVLEEGVFDVIFAVAAATPIVEAIIFLPIYTVRLLVYAFFYTYETVAGLSASLDKAIELRSKEKITESEFNGYMKENIKRETKVDQGLKKAESNIRFELEADRKTLMNTSVQNAEDNVSVI